MDNFQPCSIRLYTLKNVFCMTILNPLGLVMELSQKENSACLSNFPAQAPRYYNFEGHRVMRTVCPKKVFKITSFWIISVDFNCSCLYQSLFLSLSILSLSLSLSLSISLSLYLCIYLNQKTVYRMSLGQVSPK